MRRSGAGCWPPARARQRLRQRRDGGGRRGRRAATSCGRPSRVVDELTRAPSGGRGGAARDRRRAATNVRAAAAQIWLTRPSRSRKCLPTSVAGCTPSPTSFEMTTVGALRAAAAVAVSRAAASDDVFVVAPPQKVADPERDAVDDHERVGRERERGARGRAVPRSSSTPRDARRGARRCGGRGRRRPRSEDWWRRTTTPP